MIHNLVVAEGEAGWELKRALLYHCDAPAVRVLERFPGEAEWEYLLSIYGPEAVWLEAEDPELCAETARIVKRVRRQELDRYRRWSRSSSAARDFLAK